MKSAMKTGSHIRSLGALGALALFPMAAVAHTGVGSHAGFGAGFGHPFAGLDHLLAMAAVGLWAAQMGGRALWAVPVAFVVFMIAGGALGLSGVAMPMVESGILLSVVVLGALAAVAIRIPLLLSVLAVGAFAIFHGHAHGTEAPLAGSALGYSLGFALATALLHAAGVAVGVSLKNFQASYITRWLGGAIAMSGMALAIA